MSSLEPGFLVVRGFASLYARFPEPADQPIYGIPVRGTLPESLPKRYRGIDREALEPWSTEDLERGFPGIPLPERGERAACQALFELESRGGTSGDFIRRIEDAQRIYSLLEAPNQRELIWTAPSNTNGSRPKDYQLFGFEPTWYAGNHFSAVCDCMFFPRWHGTDAEGTLFKDHFERLNEFGLFDSYEAAKEFLTSYRSQEWTESGDWVIAEVCGLPG